MDFENVAERVAGTADVSAGLHTACFRLARSLAKRIFGLAITIANITISRSSTSSNVLERFKIQLAFNLCGVVRVVKRPTHARHT